VIWDASCGTGDRTPPLLVTTRTRKAPLLAGTTQTRAIGVDHGCDHDIGVTFRPAAPISQSRRRGCCPGNALVEWIITDGLTDYLTAVAWMEARADAIARGEADEAIWLLEHRALYTAGTSANAADLTDPDRFPVYAARRGGQYTYHGPGQRVVYVMLDVGKRGRDVRQFVQQLETWIITALADFSVTGEIRPGRVGVWVQRPEKAALPDGSPREDKIAAIGIRLRKWISFHGLSINLDPDLEHFTGIVPCGISGHGVTSLVDLGLPVTMNDLDLSLKHSFETVFGESTSPLGSVSQD